MRTDSHDGIENLALETNEFRKYSCGRIVTFSKCGSVGGIQKWGNPIWGRKKSPPDKGNADVTDEP